MASFELICVAFHGRKAKFVLNYALREIVLLTDSNLKSATSLCTDKHVKE